MKYNSTAVSAALAVKRKAEMVRKELAEPAGTNTSHSHRSGGKVKLCPFPSTELLFPQAAAG